MNRCKLDKLISYSPSLCGIDSIEERQKMIETGETILNALLLQQMAPEQLSADELKAIKKMKKRLPEWQKDLVAEIYLAKYLDMYFTPPEYTLEEIKNLYATGLYFTKAEIMEIIHWEFAKPEEECNFEVVNFLFDCIEKNLFLNSVADADESLFG